MAVSYQELLERAKRYCAYQERATSEVVMKLEVWKAGSEQVDTVLAELKQEAYLDDERFASAFVRGKHNIRKWGRGKIRSALRVKKIEESIISRALDEINEAEYLEQLETIIEQKKRSLPETTSPASHKKIINHALAKGYELNLIYRILNK